MKKGHQISAKKNELSEFRQRAQAAAYNQAQVINRLQTLPETMLHKTQEYNQKSNFKFISRSMYSFFEQNQTLNKFLQSVAFGKQDTVEQLFKDVYSKYPSKIQEALRYQGKLIDYSNRTFNCTAFEYAYWAKDAHMCRLLERYMDNETRAQIMLRINVIEEEGLLYQQNGQTHQSAHFDFTPLKQSYWRYLDGFELWCAQRDWLALDVAWLDLGKAQRDVPAHVAQEYCRLNRSFFPTPDFNNSTLPRHLIFLQQSSGALVYWFPLASTHSGLGYDYALTRGVKLDRCVAFNRAAGPYSPGQRPVSIDLIAINRLDEVRTHELKLLCEQLMVPIAPRLS